MDASAPASRQRARTRAADVCAPDSLARVRGGTALFAGALRQRSLQVDPSNSASRARTAGADDATPSSADARSTSPSVVSDTSSRRASVKICSVETDAEGTPCASASVARTTCVTLYSSEQRANWKTVASGVPPISRCSAKTSVTCWKTRSTLHGQRA